MSTPGERFWYLLTKVTPQEDRPSMRFTIVIFLISQTLVSIGEENDAKIGEAVLLSLYLFKGLLSGIVLDADGLFRHNPVGLTLSKRRGRRLTSVIISQIINNSSFASFT